MNHGRIVGLFGCVLAACVGDGTVNSDGGTSDAASDTTVNDSGGDACSTMCGSGCVDLQSDPNNCGACGRKCGEDAGTFACIAGQCGDTVVQVAAGSEFRCALLLDGSVYCWGRSDHFQLGVDPQSSDPVCNAAGAKCKGPTKVMGLADAAHIALGDEFGCAIKKDQSLVCWGMNDQAQLATDPGTFAHSSTPVAINLPAKVAYVVGGSATACALTIGGDVYCWGSNQTAVAGNATNVAYVVSPNKLKFSTPDGGTASDVTAIALSGDTSLPHGCAIRNSDTVWCWGGDYGWELGEQFTSGGCNAPGGICEAVPINVPNLTGVVAIGVAGGASCAVTGLDGVVHCWGSTRFGLVGFGNCVEANATWVVTTVVGLPGKAINRLSMNEFSTFAQDGQGNTWAWGINQWGDQGDGTRGGAPQVDNFACRATPTSITDIGIAKQVSAGRLGGVALRADNSVIAWGLNDVGQTGHAPITQGDTPECSPVDAGQPCNPTPSVVPLP